MGAARSIQASPCCGGEDEEDEQAHMEINEMERQRSRNRDDRESKHKHQTRETLAIRDDEEAKSPISIVM